jgi:hypothetical protein
VLSDDDAGEASPHNSIVLAGQNACFVFEIKQTGRDEPETVGNDTPSGSFAKAKR